MNVEIRAFYVYLIVQENVYKMFTELILCTSKSLMVFQVKFNVSEKKRSWDWDVVHLERYLSGLDRALGSIPTTTRGRHTYVQAC